MVQHVKSFDAKSVNDVELGDFVYSGSHLGIKCRDSSNFGGVIRHFQAKQVKI